jgi:hypothetical protein
MSSSQTVLSDLFKTALQPYQTSLRDLSFQLLSTLSNTVKPTSSFDITSIEKSMFRDLVCCGVKLESFAHMLQHYQDSYYQHHQGLLPLIATLCMALSQPLPISSSDAEGCSDIQSNRRTTNSLASNTTSSLTATVAVVDPNSNNKNMDMDPDESICAQSTITCWDTPNGCAGSSTTSWSWSSEASSEIDDIFDLHHINPYSTNGILFSATASSEMEELESSSTMDLAELELGLAMAAATVTPTTTVGDDVVGLRCVIA